MRIDRLDISGVRNIRKVRLEHLAQANVFYGPNGSGKTSLLEAIHIAGMARSFRTSKIKPVISNGAPHCVVYVQQRAHGSESAGRIGEIGRAHV